MHPTGTIQIEVCLLVDWFVVNHRIHKTNLNLSSDEPTCSPADVVYLMQEDDIIKVSGWKKVGALRSQHLNTVQGVLT